ncbi:MAG: 2-oxoacid:acceptor oxidoreductase subunit alpha [Candidatus Omnitrophota bacterium]
MRDELTIKIAGEAGQGTQTIGMALCRLFKMAGLNIFSHQDVMSRIRGGNNFTQVRVSNKPAHTLRSLSDIVVALDKNSVALHRQNMASGGLLILDKKAFNISDEDSVFFDAPFYDMAKNVGGSELFINSAGLGILAGLTGIEFNNTAEVLTNTLLGKSEDIISKNIETARAGYDFSRAKFKQGAFAVKTGTFKEGLLMNGHDAVALGAIRAGCKFYSGYPMSPSTSIMNVVAGYAKDFNIVVEQAEDEIAAINMILGASFAGARSMCATSGGGFALMVEGLSLSGMTETPIVVVDAQRPAPATGLPTRTEQADLDYLIHSGHGEFARVVFSPGTIEEAFYLTVKAFNLAEKYQVPVLIMTDQHLAESYRNIGMFDLNQAKAERFIISKEDSKKIADYKRYRLTASGISPRAIPSWIEDVIYVDSDEHTEEGHITEDAAIRTKMVEKRFYKKMAGLSKEIQKPTARNLKGAKVILIGFGSTYGVMKEASDTLKNKKIGFLHLSQVWPFPAKEITRLLKNAKKTITVENNAAGQLARLIRRETGIKIDRSILKFDGRPFNLDFLVERIKAEA